MKWLYGAIVVFAALTICYLYHNCRKGTVTRKSFLTVLLLEGAAAVLSLILLFAN